MGKRGDPMGWDGDKKPVSPYAPRYAPSLRNCPQLRLFGGWLHFVRLSRAQT